MNLGIRIGTLALLAARTLATSTTSARQGAARKPLYDRLDGLNGIAVVVDDFIDRLVASETLNRNPAIVAGGKTSLVPCLKFQVAQLVCEASGGPCKYTGRGMKRAHAHLNISSSGSSAAIAATRRPQ